MTLFSLLFGAGVLLLTERLEQNGRVVKAIYFRRNSWLLVFGLAHAYLLWTGDILMVYAFCAFVVFFLRNLKATWLSSIAILFFLVPTLLMLSGGAAMADLPSKVYADMLESWQPGQASIEVQLEAYRGSWLEQMAKRVSQSFTQHSYALLFWGFWHVSGLILVGMALYKWGVLTARRSRTFYLRLRAIGTAGLLVLTVCSKTLLPTGPLATHVLGAINLTPGAVFLWRLATLVWSSCLFSLVYLSAFSQRLLRWGAQPSATTCFTHLFAPYSFYGHGFGLYSSVDRLGQALITVTIRTVQIALSVWWLKQFRFGLAEWLWRSLTHGKFQVMRLKAYIPLEESLS